MDIHTLLFVLLLIFSFIQSSRGATKGRLFTNLGNSLEVTAKPVKDGLVLEGGKDVVKITWKLKSLSKVDADATFKKIIVKFCYAPISQVGTTWRKTHKELSKEKSWPYEIVSKPYDMTPQSLDWIIKPDIPTGTYFVRVYGIDGNGHKVAYGQSSDDGRSVQGISGCHVLLDIASICFSVFSIVFLLVAFVKEKRKAKLEQRSFGVFHLC